MPVVIKLPTDHQETNIFLPYSKQPCPPTRQPHAFAHVVTISTDNSRQTPSPITTPTTPTTSSPCQSPTDTSFCSSLSKSVAISEEQQIANIILQEGSQTEGGRILIPNVDSQLYDHIAALVSGKTTERLRYYHDVKVHTIVIDRLASSIHESLTSALYRLQDQLEEWLGTQFNLKVEVNLVGTEKYNMFDELGDIIRGKSPDQGYEITVIGRFSEVAGQDSMITISSQAMVGDIIPISSSKLGFLKLTIISKRTRSSGFAVLRITQSSPLSCSSSRNISVNRGILWISLIGNCSLKYGNGKPFSTRCMFQLLTMS